MAKLEGILDHVKVDNLCSLLSIYLSIHLSISALGTNVALFVQPRLSFPDLLSYGSNDGVLANLRRFVTSDFHAVTIDRVSDPVSAFKGLVDDRVRLVEVSSLENIDEKLDHSDPNFVNVFKIVLPVGIWLRINVASIRFCFRF